MIHQHTIDQASIDSDIDQIIITLHNLARTLYAQQQEKKNDCNYSLNVAHDRLRMIAQDLSMVTRDLKTARFTASYRTDA
jgi:hypothetical protein